MMFFVDDVDRSVIGESGVVKLFEEQLDLGLTGVCAAVVQYSNELTQNFSYLHCYWPGVSMLLIEGALTSTIIFSY